MVDVPAISENAFRILLESVPDGFFIHDVTGRFLDVNARSCSDLGYTREELLTLRIDDISIGASPFENAEKWENAPQGLAITFQELAIRKDGSTFPVEISLTCQQIKGEKLFFGVARDMTERESARASIEAANRDLEAKVAVRTRELRDAHDRMIMAAQVGGLGIWDYDLTNDVMLCDARWYRIVGLDPARPIRHIAEFKAIIHPDDADRATEVTMTAAKLIADHSDYGIQFRIIRPDGELRWLRSAACIVQDAAGRAARAVGFVVDITEAWMAETRLQQQSFEDPLTGLANRRRLDEELAKACLHAARTDDAIALVMIDVDHFKLYNDHYGHVSGDSALRQVAGILASIAQRPHDLVARFGGEEFLLLLPGVREPETILNRIRDELASHAIPHLASSVAPSLTVSCGCVVAINAADATPLGLLAACDDALYRAKEGGRNRAEIVRL